MLKFRTNAAPMRSRRPHRMPVDCGPRIALPPEKTTRSAPLRRAASGRHAPREDEVAPAEEAEQGEREDAEHRAADLPAVAFGLGVCSSDPGRQHPSAQQEQE